MLYQILDFGFSVLILVGSDFANEAVFSQIFPNRMKTVTIEQQSLREDLISNLLDVSFDVLNNIKLDDLENIMTTEFAQGLPSDIEFSGW